MEERLQVRIEADIKNFQEGMEQAERNLKRAEGFFSSASKSVFQLENAIANLSQQFKDGEMSEKQYTSTLDSLNTSLSDQRDNVTASAKEMERLNKLLEATSTSRTSEAVDRTGNSFATLGQNAASAGNEMQRMQGFITQTEGNLAKAEAVLKRYSTSIFDLENAQSKLGAQYRSGAISQEEFGKKINKINSQLESQRGSVKAAEQEIRRLNQTLEKTETVRFATNTQKAETAMMAFSRETRYGQSVALNFNRALRNSPSGLRYAGTALQQLAGSFSNLQREAGGTGKALKIAFSQLITGPNLALLAVSALTAGITAYQMGALDFLNVNKTQKQVFDELKKSLTEYKDELDDLSRANLQGSSDATKQISILDSLSTQAQNTALSTKQRTDAVKELQKVFPEHFANLTEEEIKTGNVGTAMDELRNSLIQTARAYAVIDKVRQNSITILELESRTLTRAAEMVAKLDKLRSLSTEEKDIRSSGGLALAGQALESIDLSRTRLNDEINKLLEKQTEDSKELTKINNENLSLQEGLNKALEEGGNLAGNLAGELNKFGKSVHPGDLVGWFPFKLDKKKLEKDIDEGFKFISDRIKSQQGAPFIDFKIKMDIKPEDLDFDTALQNDQFNEAWKERIKTIENFGKQMQNTLARSFEGAIVRGEDFFTGVIDGFRRMLAKLAAQLAASAVIKVLGMIIGGPAGMAIGSGGSSIIGSLLGGSNMRVAPTQAINISAPPMSGESYKVDVNVAGVLRGNDIHVANQRNNRDFDRFY